LGSVHPCWHLVFFFVIALSNKELTDHLLILASGAFNTIALFSGCLPSSRCPGFSVPNSCCCPLTQTELHLRHFDTCCYETFFTCRSRENLLPDCNVGFTAILGLSSPREYYVGLGL